MNYDAVQEYLTSNDDIAYPFKEDGAYRLCQVGETAVHGASATVPRDFFSDMVFVAPAALQGQVYLTSIARTMSGLWTFTFSSGAGDLLVETITGSPATYQHQMLEFDSEIANGIVCRLVTGPGFKTYMDGLAPGGVDDFALGLPLETATMEFTPHKLSSILADATSMAGDIVLYEGYNIRLDSVPENTEAGTPSRITVTAGAGLGMGRHNGCGDLAPVDYVGRINGQTGDDRGRFFLTEGNCYRVIDDADNNRLQLYNDCTPCCDCEDYTNVLTALKVLFDDLKIANLIIFGDIGTGQIGLVEQLNTDITDWNTKLIPYLFKPTLNISVTLGNLFVNPLESGRSPNYASCLVSVKNPYEQQVTGLVLTVTIPGNSGASFIYVVYFDALGQHVLPGEGGNIVNFPSMILPPNSFLKTIILVKCIYPNPVTGAFSAKITYDGGPVEGVTAGVTI